MIDYKCAFLCSFNFIFNPVLFSFLFLFLFLSNTTNWPSKLIMQLLPIDILNHFSDLFVNTKTLTFNFASSDVEAMKSLYRILGNSLVSIYPSRLFRSKLVISRNVIYLSRSNKQLGYPLSKISISSFGRMTYCATLSGLLLTWSNSMI